MEKNYYKVVVRVDVEKENGKIKHTKENYIVGAGSPQGASDIVEKEMEYCQYEWEIHSVTLQQISKIIL